MTQKDIKLIIIGKGIEYENLRKLIKSLDLEDKIKILTNIDDKTLKLYINASIGLILPSRYEYFGLVQLEAMTFGKPIINTNVLGARTVAENNKEAITIEPNNVNALSKALISLYENPNLRQTIGQNGYKKYLEKFKQSIWEKRIKEAIDS